MGEEVKMIAESSLSRSLAEREERVLAGTFGVKRRLMWNRIDVIGQLETKIEEGITNAARARVNP